MTAKGPMAPPPPFLPSVAGEEPNPFSSWELCKTSTEFGGWVHGLPFLSLSSLLFEFPGCSSPKFPKVSFLPQDNGIWERMGVFTQSLGGRINFLPMEALERSP